MRAFLSLLALLAACGVTQAEESNLAKIDRSIEKQPEYFHTPHYALLAFGPEPKTRVWFVLDGKIIYLDRNGNGDLTEAGERIELGSRTSISLGDITETDGITTHTGLYVYIYEDLRFRLRINIAGGKGRQTVGWGRSKYPKPRLAKRPEDAPVIHLNGPLTFGRYGPMSIIPRNPNGHSIRLTSLRLFVGSRGIGHGTFAGYGCSLTRCESGLRKPTAEIEFPNRDPKGEPIRVTQVLDAKT